LQLPDGKSVRVEIQSRYPANGEVQVKIHLEQNSPFSLKLRMPAWCSNATLAVNDRMEKTALRPGEYAALRREWHDGDTINLTMPITLRAIVGEHGNLGKVAFARGPLVLAADDTLNPDAPIDSYAIPAADLKGGKLMGAQGAVVSAIRTDSSERNANKTFNLQLTSFAEAGSTLGRYQVWLPLAESKSGARQSP